MDTQTKPTLRHGLREDQCLRYAANLRAILDTWPQPSYHSPKGDIKSLETLRARMRDAAVSFTQNAWPSLNLDHSRFSELMPQLIIGIDQDRGQVVAGPKKLHTDVAATASRQIQSHSLNITTEDSEVIMALVTLHFRKALEYPTNLFTSINPQPFVEGIDVSIVQKGDKHYVIA